ncbi:MAG: exocyst complex subunit Sec6, partial [Amphiamblys sp. WSBS2006]
MRSTKELLSAITRIQNELDKSDEIYKDGQALFSDYDAIRAAGLIYRNTHETQMFHDRFRKLDAIYRRVEELLEAPETNILLIHFYVHGLQAFKRMCMEKETNTAETEIAVSRQFERLDNIEREYENTLWGMADRILFYCAEKKTHVAVWIAHIVRKSARTEDLFRRLDTVARKKIETDAGHSIGDRLNGMSFYKDDLAVVRDTVARCFPETIQVHDFLARSYHRHIAAQFRRIATENATAPEILSLLSWAGEYYSTMQTDHSMKRGSLDPDLLGQREEALVRKYIALCSGKIAAWLLGLAKTERKYFTERAALPEKNENNVYFSPSGIDLFQIVKQHIEAAKKTRNDRLSREIMLQCVVSIGVFQKEICAGIDEETRKYVSAIKDDTETAPFFEEYAQMIGNTALRWVGYMAMVEGNLGTELSPEEQIKLETCNAGFVEIAKKANNALWEGVKASLSPVFARLYGEEWLASGSGEGGAVVATLEDYFADYKDGMHPYLFSTL